MLDKALIGFLAGIAFVLVFLRRKELAPLPPGPKPLPLLGNILQLKEKYMWKLAVDWYKEYGKLVYANAAGIPMIFINDFQANEDLINMRGDKYADKPKMVMLNELCGGKYILAFIGTDDAERVLRQRRIMKKALGPGAIPSYELSMETSTRQLLLDLTSKKTTIEGALLMYTSSVTLSILYGHQVVSSDDELVKITGEAAEVLSNKIAAGTKVWAVDILPFLRHIPAWFPGAAFKRLAAEWKAVLERSVNVPYERSVEEIRQGRAVASAVLISLGEDPKPSPEYDLDLRWSLNAMYLGSIDSSIAGLENFILAMVKYPEVLKKAQEEIDSAVGRSRLPTFSDRSSLPYVEAMLTETLRWGCPVPLNFPHLSVEDVYEGYRIPKGSYVLGNLWVMSRDERLYPDPEVFRPERFLGHPYTEDKAFNPWNYIFGTGKRKCPGVHLIQSSLWLVIARVVAALDIKPKVVNGVPIEVNLKEKNAFFRMYDGLECEITTRAHVNLDQL
ncbi:cytochrome P450 [Thelephora ganbajun]|uniref:Cytochrome P450 n=1 Tax=Thelephora ganbajun TaxID=370292 RepID=A0ACB6YZK8_THEGA|nr:cytochrome P450 [Thelephora ganbajun]